MIKNKTKLLLIILCAILLCACVLAVVEVSTNSRAFAVTNKYFSAEKYTESDYLLNSDGTEDNDKDLGFFVDYVKSRGSNEIVEYLDSVIPLEILEWEDDEYKTFSYMGKEYGYYIYKNGKMYYVLLIDFIFEPVQNSFGNREFKIQVKPILQQCFKREKVLGVYEWVKGSNDRFSFYISNPRFWTEVSNANALNYGDEGYSKQLDEGVIIDQIRFNYSKVLIPSSASVMKSLLKYAADVVIDTGIAVYDEFVDFPNIPIGKIKNAIDKVVEFNEVLTEALEVKTFEANNENNIKTSLSKSAQRQDENLKTYSRFAGVAVNDNMLLDAVNDSYAEMIVSCNETNYRSRLLQMCDFDIYCKESFYTEPVKVNGQNGEESFGFYREQTIFDNQAPKFEVGDDFDKTGVSVYMLPLGNQYINFTPTYSGEYTFQPPQGSVLTLNGAKGVKFNLLAGQEYKFILENTLNTKIIGNLGCTVKHYEKGQSYSINPNTDYLISYRHSTSDYIKVETLNSNVKIGILDENLQVVDEPNDNIAFGNFVEGKNYYFVLNNTMSSILSTQVEISPVNEMSLGQDYSITVNDQVLSFKNGNVAVSYKLQLINCGNSKISVTDNLGHDILTGAEYFGNDAVYTFILGANKQCYINFSHTDGSVIAHMYKSPTQYKWLIDGKLVDSLRVRLKPNTTYSITAEISADGQNFETVNGIDIQTSVMNYSFINGSLKIGSVANTKEIILIPKVAPDFRLIVEIDDMITKIKLNHGGGTGFYELISVELGKPITCSGVTTPRRIGYTFKGYFDSKQDSDNNTKQYINEYMVGQIWDKDVDNATLYAHWTLNRYTLTLDNGVGSVTRYFSYKMVYGAAMPTERKFAPKKDGHFFRGYFSEPNGKGTKYYDVTSELVDDRQGADIYGYSHYYLEGMYFCHSESKWLFEHDVTLYAYWELMEGPYYCEHMIEGSSGSSSATRLYLTHGVPITVTAAPNIVNAEFKCFLLNGKEIYDSTITWTPYLKRDITSGEIVPTEPLVELYTPTKCVSSGTLITLSDGTQVPVESLTGNETLLAWNMLTGKNEAAKILFIDKDAEALYQVINLGFSDGTVVKVISEHGFWDYDLNEYVYLRSDAGKYIGHYFNKGDSRVQLISVDVREEYTTAYSPVTYGYLCYYVNGMLSMPGGISGLFNIFEVDPDTMTVNAEAMACDIARYGLFTYDEFSELVPVPEDVFNAFNGQYLKVAIGKGLITVDQLNYLASRYAEFFV